MTSRSLSFSLIGAALFVAQSAFATTWDISPPSIVTTNNEAGNYGYGKLTATVSGAPTLTGTAWANTGNSGYGANTNSSSYTLESAYLTNQSSSGVGIKNQDASGSYSYGDRGDGTSPEHSVDNQQRNDMVLFQFDDKVNVTSIDINWTYSGSNYDSDFSVLAWTGTGTPDTLAGQTYDNLQNGWTLIAQVNSYSTGTKDFSTQSAGIFSSYWLIGAYNSYVGGSCSGCDDGDDFIKIAALAGATCADLPPGTPGCTTSGGGGGGGTPGNTVPEPTTLGLLGLGMLGMLRMRKRQA